MITFPKPILKRLFFTFLVGCSCFFVGIAYYYMADDSIFLWLSLLVFVCSIFKSFSLYFIVKRNTYCTIEGTCKQMQRLLIQNCNRIILESSDGETLELLLDKNYVLNPGASYRIYFKTDSGISPGRNPIMEKALLTDNFFGIERIDASPTTSAIQSTFKHYI